MSNGLAEGQKLVDVEYYICGGCNNDYPTREAAMQCYERHIRLSERKAVVEFIRNKVRYNGGWEFSNQTMIELEDSVKGEK